MTNRHKDRYLLAGCGLAGLGLGLHYSTYDDKGEYWLNIKRSALWALAGYGISLVALSLGRPTQSGDTNQRSNNVDSDD